MKIQLPICILSKSLVLLVFLTLSTKLTAQEIKMEKMENPILYLSASYVSSMNKNHVTHDDFYSAASNGDLYGLPGKPSNKTVRVDLGIHISDRVSLEVGYMRMPLDLSKQLDFDPLVIDQSSVSYARISFYSIRLNHRVPLWKNRLFFKTGLGYALGKSSNSFEQIGPSSQETYTVFENTITTSNTISSLYSGTNSNHLLLNLGVEIGVFTKLSLFANYTVSKGFKDLQEEKTDYIINGTAGTFTTTADGSYNGFELGLKFKLQ